MPKWNPMQEKAIYTKDKNILVSASAGSGKTTVLIARLLHLVQDEKMDVESILAMTFTEAAANEMKKRLAIALKEAIANTQSMEEKQYLNKQLAKVANASISTIHGFCLKIIQNYYYMISLDKERVGNVMDETTTTLFMDACMKETFQFYYEQGDPFQQLCALFDTRPERDDTLKEEIIRLFYLAQSKSNPIMFLMECKQQGTITSLQQLDEGILYYFYDYLKVQINSILQSLQEAMMAYAEIEKIDVVKAKKDVIEIAYQHLDKQQYTSFREMFIPQCKELIPTEKDNELVKTKKKEIEDLENNLLSILYEEEQFVSFHNENTNRISLLVDVCLDFLHRYEAKKEQAKYIDFSDMEHLALQILEANDGMVANLYREQFLEIMVDEFQDSNDVQDYLVKLICRPNNVFRVGDIKQSIYGFRHASPSIMKQLIENKTNQDEVIYLSNNYRSKKSIVDFNNVLFNDLMNIQGFSSSFNQEDYAYTGLTHQEQDNEPIIFHNIHQDCMKESNLSKDALKANYIANQILQLKEKHQYTFKDFVVLVKTHAKSAFLREAFEALSIPYFISMKHGFYNSSAVQYVISFLKALHNPNDDIAMCATLLSPFFAYRDSDLVKARLHKQKQSYYHYFKDELTAFQTLRTMSKNRKVSVLLEAIYAFENFYDTRLNAQEKSNLDKLFEIVTTREATTYLTLDAFLHTLDKTQDTQIGEAIPIGHQDDVVQVMSIHQSKGLQFPIVFLYSTSQISVLDTRGIITYDADLKIGLQYMNIEKRFVYPSVERLAINHKITRSQLEEEMRVLYVATTRAQTQMHLVDVGVNDTFPILNQIEIYKKKGFSAWITQSLAHQAFALYRFINVEHMWDNHYANKQTNASHQLPHYHKASSIIQSSSPSESEWINFTPRLYNPYEEVAMERGNTLHKMVELLPHQVTLETLQETARKHALTLSNQDQETLLALYENELFNYSLQGEVFHEYPFMIKDNNLLSHGYMDYVSILTNEIILIDFKSDRNITKQELKTRYQDQLKSYQKALSLLYPNKPCQAYVYSFSLQDMIKI